MLYRLISRGNFKLRWRRSTKSSSNNLISFRANECRSRLFQAGTLRRGGDPVSRALEKGASIRNQAKPGALHITIRRGSAMRSKSWKSWRH